MDEAMMKMVVEAVLKEIGHQRQQKCCNKEGYDKLLVVGNVEDVPSYLSEEYEIFPIDDFICSGNIYRYKRILITGLTLTQLSDIAQGRDGSVEAAVVVNGLLCGLEVSMTEGALPHRKYASKTNSRIYQVIENNVKMIQTFGVKMLSEKKLKELPPAKPAKYQAPKLEIPKGNAVCNTDRLITEDVAKALISSGDKKIVLAANAIVTPSAWDLFHLNGIEVTK